MLTSALLSTLESCIANLPSFLNWVSFGSVTSLYPMPANPLEREFRFKFNTPHFLCPTVSDPRADTQSLTSSSMLSPVWVTVAASPEAPTSEVRLSRDFVASNPRSSVSAERSSRRLHASLHSLAHEVRLSRDFVAGCN